MGINWDHSYNLFVEQDVDGMAVHDGTGRRDVYFRGTNGLYTRNEFFNEGRLDNGAFTLTFPDTGRWLFHAFDGSAWTDELQPLHQHRALRIGQHRLRERERSCGNLVPSSAQ